ncbi:MAG: helix-turn-helix transcriptional regulator [Lachnospiraceae bacterium]|nr:helix-turn-helix transcriptional regulator [Lachnospiraceae bacterium]MBQ2320382.1 helix-turn-helix transcriptional regulator [Lachnospiraceae bacterium]
MPVTDAPLTEAFYYILLALRKPKHGYGVIQEVEELTNGRVQLGAGTLYGALQSLEKRGWIEIYSADESSRKKKEYIITSLGEKAFHKELERLKELVGNGRLMEEDKNG